MTFVIVVFVMSIVILAYWMRIFELPLEAIYLYKEDEKVH